MNRTNRTNRTATSLCGLGAVTGYGWGIDAMWSGLNSGKSAALPTPGCHTDPDALSWVAKVPDGGDPADGRSRFARAMRAAGREAISDALARGWSPGRRVGLLHAVVLGEVDLWRDLYQGDGELLSRRDYMSLMPSTPISMLLQEYGFHGPTMAVSAMCASGNAAMITAKLWLDAGMCDDVVVIASDLSLTPENVMHFRKLGVSFTDRDPLEGCRPFQPGSIGFVMGEASVGFVVSRRPVASPYAVLLGGAMTNDAHHVVSIDPGLTHVLECFSLALADAGVSAADVRWHNAHGTGTAQCDSAEATALDRLLGARTQLFSMKPMLGHCQGAASAAELAVTAMGYDTGLLPAPYVLDGHAQQIDGPTPVGGGITLKSALGMGGHNAVVLLDGPT